MPWFVQPVRGFPPIRVSLEVKYKRLVTAEWFENEYWSSMWRRPRAIHNLMPKVVRSALSFSTTFDDERASANARGDFLTLPVGICEFRPQSRSQHCSSYFWLPTAGLRFQDTYREKFKE